MGATNNKPLRSESACRRRRRFNPRNLWRRGAENEVNDLSNDQRVQYYSDRGNTQNNYSDPASFWGEQDQVYHNGQNYDFRPNNVSDNNYIHQESVTPYSWSRTNLVNSQYSNTEYNLDGASSDYNLDRNGENSDQHYYNKNLTYGTPQPDGDYNLMGFNEEHNSRSESVNYNYCMGQPGRAVIRRHSLNNGRTRPQFHQIYQNSHRSQVQSYSLNNVNNYDTNYREQSSLFGLTCYASDTNVYQNHNAYPRHWKGSGLVDTITRRCNSANGINSVGKVTRGGKKRNSLDEDFYGEDFCGSSPHNLYGSQGLRNSDSNVDANYDGPRVKRRPTCESQEGNPEGSNSALSVHEGTSCSDSTDFAYDNLNLEFNQSDEQTNVLNILQFPPGWSSYSVNNTGLVDISATSGEGEKLRRFFYKTARTREYQLNIIGIARIENPFLHTLYLLKKEEMRIRNEHVDELHLYHGTKKENIAKICEDNFNWRLFSEKHKFGKGVSFSPLASYSSHYCDNSDVKVMLLLKVLVSNADIGTPEMEIPPIINGVTYDTSIKEDTSVIVKYSDNEFYPLYKITYRKHIF